MRDVSEEHIYLDNREQSGEFRLWTAVVVSAVNDYKLIYEEMISQLRNGREPRHPHLSGLLNCFASVHFQNICAIIGFDGERIYQYCLHEIKQLRKEYECLKKAHQEKSSARTSPQKNGLDVQESKLLQAHSRRRASQLKVSTKPKQRNANNREKA